jgi:hypothetical protein
VRYGYLAKMGKVIIPLFIGFWKVLVDKNSELIYNALGKIR